MLKTKLFLLALVALCSAATVFGEIVWSSAIDFDGTPTSVPVEIDVSTPIVVSTALRDNFKYCLADGLITVTATAQSDPTCVAAIAAETAPGWGELTTTAVWNFKDSKYDLFPKNDTYTLQETIETDEPGTTILTRSITLAPEPSLIIVLGLIGALLMRRRIKGVLAVLLLATIGSFNAWAGGTITSLTCQQGWPLSRKVIITYYYSVDSYCEINHYGTTDDGATIFNLKDRGTVVGDRADYYPGYAGTQTVVWEPDSTLDNVKGKIKIGVEIHDLNGVSDSSSTTRDQYRYMSLIPSDEWNDTYEMIKMALKLIPAETSTKGTPPEEEDKAVDHETKPQVTSRKSFIGDKKC